MSSEIKRLAFLVEGNMELIKKQSAAIDAIATALSVLGESTQSLVHRVATLERKSK